MIQSSHQKPAFTNPLEQQRNATAIVGTTIATMAAPTTWKLLSGRGPGTLYASAMALILFAGSDRSFSSSGVRVS